MSIFGDHNEGGWNVGKPAEGEIAPTNEAKQALLKLHAQVEQKKPVSEAKNGRKAEILAGKVKPQNNLNGEIANGVVNTVPYSAKKRPSSWYKNMAVLAEGFMRDIARIKLGEGLSVGGQKPASEGLNKELLEMIDSIKDFANQDWSEKDFHKMAHDVLMEKSSKDTSKIYGAKGVFNILTAYSRAQEDSMGRTYSQLPDLVLSMRKGYRHENSYPSRGKTKDLTPLFEDHMKNISQGGGAQKQAFDQFGSEFNQPSGSDADAFKKAALDAENYFKPQPKRQAPGAKQD